MDLSDRAQFLNLAALFEIAMVLLAFFIGWLVDVEPLAQLRIEWAAAVYGVVAAVPLCLFFAVTHRFAVGPLRRIKQLLVEMLGPSLSACRWYDLLLLSLLVGFSEELLFRGVLQPWFETGGWIVGLVASNVVFGLAHFITPVYAVVAGLIGIYLGLLMDLDTNRNVLTPMITHGLYDYIAFLVVVRTYRRQKSEQPAES